MCAFSESIRLLTKKFHSSKWCNQIIWRFDYLGHVTVKLLLILWDALWDMFTCSWCSRARVIVWHELNCYRTDKQPQGTLASIPWGNICAAKMFLLQWHNHLAFHLVWTPRPCERRCIIDLKSLCKPLTAHKAEGAQGADHLKAMTTQPLEITGNDGASE